MAAGRLGGLPGSPNFPASIANVRIGGRSMLVGMLAGGIVLASMVGLSPVLGRVPYAAIAGAMIMLGWNIIDWPFLRRIHRVSRDHAIVMLTTFALLIFADYIAAALVGMLLAGLTTMRRMVGPDIRGHRTVMMDFSRTLYIDDTAAMVIRELVNIALTERRECVIVGLHAAAARTLTPPPGLPSFRRQPESTISQSEKSCPSCPSM